MSVCPRCQSDTCPGSIERMRCTAWVNGKTAADEAALQARVAGWNRTYPPGTIVRYWPGSAGHGELRTARTAGAAFLYGDEVPAVAVEVGYAGHQVTPVPLDRVDTIVVPDRYTSADRERLDRARQTLIDVGYFSANEVGDDVAPRIAELVTAIAEGKFDPADAFPPKEPTPHKVLTKIIETALDGYPLINLSRGDYEAVAATAAAAVLDAGYIPSGGA